VKPASFLADPVAATARLCRLLAGILALAWLAPARAQADIPAPPVESPWSVSGFGTLGAVRKSGGADWGFVRNSTQRGASSRIDATADSRVGAQINWNGGPQGLLVPNQGSAPASEIVQWAYLGWRPLPNTRIRVGRTSPDIFLFADSRNVGYALPWARPPVDFYGFAPLASIDGIDLEQRWFAGAATWRARATAGQVRASVTDVEGSRLEMRGRDTLALGLSREEGGLLLKVSYLRSQVRVDIGSGADQLRQGLEQIGSLPVPGLAASIGGLGNNLWTGGSTSYLALAAQYETGPWTLIAEGSQLRVPNSPLNARRAYASVGWRHGAVTWYGLASRVRPDDAAATAPDLAGSLSPLVGPAAAQQAQALAGYAAAAGDNYRYDQSTLGVGMRWDFAPTAALKLQVDRFDVRHHGGAAWRFYDSSAAKGTLVSVLVDFVWGQ